MIKQLLNFLPYKTSGFGYFMMFIQFFYLYQLSASNDVGGVSFSLGSILLIIFSMVSVWWFFQVIATIFSQNRWTVLLSVFICFVFYDLLIAYQFGSQELIEWSFIVSNIGLAFSFESLDVMLSTLDIGALQYIPAIALIFLPFEWRRQTVSKLQQSGSLLKKSVVGLLLYMMMIGVPIDSYDPMISFFRSVIHHHFSDLQFDQSIPENTYPFLVSSNTFSTKTVSDKQERPFVFVIICESLNQNFLNKFATNGNEITPFLNQLIDKSVYVDTFYGNSIQTAKGHFATYFSMVPVLNGKAFVNEPDLQIDSLATVLADVGYKTIYFNAHDNPRFDNVENFVTARGFQEYLTLEDFLKPEDDQYMMRWGAEDQVLFKRFFDYYDSELAKTGQPFFVSLKTSSNHFPFNSVLENRRFVYPDPIGIPKGIRQHYSNSIYLTDYGISLFFEELKKRPELKNSLVLITSDHAFPLGEHGNFNLESGYHEESFRLPLYVIWDGVLEPRRISRASSQLDIAPTVLDLLSIRDVETSFQGQSIFSKDLASIPLIQPYGKHLSVVRYPLKYRYNTRLKKEYMYHLMDDPMETKNIISQFDEPKLNIFRDELRYIYRINYAIVNNQIKQP